MTAVILTKAAVKATGSCPVWCAASHADDSRDYREHRSAGVRPTHGLYASVAWSEPLTATARFVGSGPRIYLAVGDASMSLKGWQASDLAAVMDEVGQVGAAELLRGMVALITDGGERRG